MPNLRRLEHQSSFMYSTTLNTTEQTSSECRIKAIKALRYAGCEGGGITSNLGRILFYFWPTPIYTQAADASGNAHRPSHEVFVIRRPLRNKEKEHDIVESVRMPLTLHQPLNTGCRFSLNCIKMNFHETPYSRIIKKRRKQTIKAHTIIIKRFVLLCVFATLFLPFLIRT